MSAIGCPPPLWSQVRRVCPEIAEDLQALWREAASNPELCSLLEHLGVLIDEVSAELDTYRYEFRGLGYDLRPAEATDPVFEPETWEKTLPGRWEHASGPYEAVVTLAGATDPRWRWELFHLDPSLGYLVTLDRGTSQTLADGQRQVDEQARLDRNWRRP